MTYKLFREDEQGLHPLFIDKALTLPEGVWIDARAVDDEHLPKDDDGYMLFDLHTQFMLRRQEQRPRAADINRATLNGERWMQMRKGRAYDLGLSSANRVLPFAHHPGWHTCREQSLIGVNMEGKVWRQCVICEEDTHIRHMNINGLTKESHAVEWYISSRLMIVGIKGR